MTPKKLTIEDLKKIVEHFKGIAPNDVFDYTSQGYMEAEKYLKSINMWNKVSNNGLSTDGYSIVHEANALRNRHKQQATNEMTLYTPTDWNKECDLLKQYLEYKLEFPCPQRMIATFKEQGFLVMPKQPLSFDKWKERQRPNIWDGMRIKTFYEDEPYYHNKSTQ